eukprot:gene21095-41060_t
MKTNFMSMVSHELRTPLSVILSSAEILEMIYSKLPAKEIEKGAAYINRIIGQVDKMTQLMNDFLFISKIESGKITPQLELIDINLLLNEIKEESYSPWSDGRYLKMIFKGNPNLVKFDKTMIRHILINLLNNAFKYSSNSTEAPLVRVSYTPMWWFLTVVDCGIGIEQEEINKLGEPFIRGSNVGDIEGTGLGLMTIKFFTDHHRGSFRVRIVEDEKDIRDSLKTILELNDYEVETAENGQIGLKKVIDRKPDLILCDVMMPVLDGFGLLEQLRSKSIETPLIFLTAK